MHKQAEPERTEKDASPRGVPADSSVAQAAPASGPAAQVAVLGLAFPIQRKTVVGSGADPAEMQAERVARSVIQVLRGRGGAVRDEIDPERAERVARSVVQVLRSRGGVLRDDTEPKHEHGAVRDLAPIRRMAQIGLPGGEVDDETERVLGSSAGGGSSIEPGLRGRLEGALGADLSDVRLHAGSQAADLNRRMSATAFTYGRDIYFRDGTPDTGTDQGLHLLAHELTHAVQQGAAPIRRSPGPSAVIRRRLFVDGRWYGPEDEKELTDHEKGRAGGQLPKWTDKLQEKKDYTYDEGLGDWMSVSSSMTFYKGATKSTVDSFGGDVLDKAGVRKTEPEQNEAKNPNSRGPRHPVRRTVSKVRLFKFSKETGAHWTLECEVDGGEGAKTGVKHMKIDLMNAGYRIFYGGRKQEPTKSRTRPSSTSKARRLCCASTRHLYGLRKRRVHARARGTTTVKILL